MSTIKSSDEHLTLNADGTSKDIKLQSNASEKVIIKSDGKVGIGTSSPDSNSKLHVYNGASGQSSATNNTEVVIENNSTTGISFLTPNNASSGLWFADPESNASGRFYYTHSDNSLNVFTGGTQRLKIDGDGLKFNSDTAAANALDDYEEGTWTPTVTGSSSGSGNAGSGYYTKIGRVCTISYVVNNTAFPTISGDLRISLPFTSAANQECHGSDIYFYPLSAWTSGSNFTGLIPKVGSSVSYHTFIVKGVNVDRQSNLSSSNSSISGNSNTYARYSMTYITV